MNEIDVSMFWDINHTLTYNKMINVILGNRGGGKSYGVKQWCIDNFIKRREQFGYVRRYKDDLKRPMQEFFKDIQKAYPDYEFKTEGDKFYIRLRSEEENVKWTEDDIAGYSFVLSTASNKKSIPYPDITTLFFDEFLIVKGNQRYIDDEPIKFLDLYETIARPGTGHKRVRVFLVANAISITNPYFLWWDLKMPKKQDKKGKWIWQHKDRPILVEDVKNEKFIDVKKNSEFGTLVKGTKYADYSIDNKFLLDDDTFIEKKSGNARYLFTFVYKGEEYGVWTEYNEGKMWVSKDIDPCFITKYSLTLKDHSPNTLYINSILKRRGHFKMFIDAYRRGCVRFESINIKNLTYEVIKMVMS